jgi:hypothetical protein
LTYVRQRWRARDAGDGAAVQAEEVSVCEALAALLGTLLERDPSWDTARRWIDGLIGALVAVAAPGRITVRGRMVWGLLANPAGLQWAEPFEVELTTDAGGGRLAAYVMRFGDRRRSLDEKRVATGFYATLADKDDNLVARPLFPSGGGEASDSSLAGAPAGADAPDWMHVVAKTGNEADPVFHGGPPPGSASG